MLNAGDAEFGEDGGLMGGASRGRRGGFISGSGGGRAPLSFFSSFFLSRWGLEHFLALWNR